MARALPGFLRYRIVNPRGINFSDGFEAAGGDVTLWRSLGTEPGTDNSIAYWTQAAGAWTYGSHIATPPAATTNAELVGGHLDWGTGAAGVAFAVRVSAAKPGAGICICVQSFSGVPDCYVLQFDGANTVRLYKRVGSVYTALDVAQAFTYTSGNPYWLFINNRTAGKLNYSAAPDSSGAPGTQTGFPQVTDATFSSGGVGLHANTVSSAGITFGGAFGSVCFVTGPPPDGWSPVITAGEPAFAWSGVSPQAGSKHASININGSASGNGAWQKTAFSTIAGQNTLACQIKASAGTANASAGGVTTTNGSAGYALQSGSGSMSQNPVASLNYSGAVGTAYFDSLTITVLSEITSDLPHLHQGSWQIVGFTPGMPSGSLVGGFTIPLFPPGSPGYNKHFATIYSQLQRWQRVEAYLGYNSKSIGLGRMVFAGFITGIQRTYGQNSGFVLTGVTDLGLANMSKPFPGELMSNDTTDKILKSYLGTNELGWADAFNPFTAGNYTSTALPSGSAGAWSGTTDDGLSVVSCATGTAAALIAKSGAAAGDRWHTQYLEVQVRLVPSADATNAGQVGIGFSQANANGNNSILGFVTAQKLNGRYQLQCGIQSYSGGSILRQQLAPTILMNVDDPGGTVPLTIGLLITIGGNGSGTATATLIVNGSIVLGQFQTAYDPQNLTFFPYLEFSVPASGSATAYFTNLIQFTRFTTDGPSTAAAFGNGTISASTNSLGYGVDPGPTFLDVWARLATREGWFLRYTPQPYVAGIRTLGLLDFASDPGVDRTAQARFRRQDGTLIDLSLDDNGDALTAGTEAAGLTAADSGGIAFWRDVSTLQSIGVVEDQILALTNPDFNTLRGAARRAMASKTQLGNAGHKQVKVLRSPALADTYAVLDRVTIHDPKMGVNNLSARIVAREFAEGSPHETLTLDQFSWHGQELGIA